MAYEFIYGISYIMYDIIYGRINYSSYEDIFFTKGKIILILVNMLLSFQSTGQGKDV